ncbi:MAG: hypothetical protein K8F92_15590 [Hyphomicrobium sp.]|uniref:DnaA N-terminal domain-containing protein n=1 Tax=Hyphomicrobium sp. TaxID=82 RepID=UPI001322EB6C|nr:DnaA N-terminal domain-containing protein [Hyphomicrobium sp.]KAB2938006.1 MAG: hypothetical protein F9K20_19325 [Hyphomicrobium sp.]MBZ0211053.1 hypothetical protein [Hyphomicrobium sp.]
MGEESDFGAAVAARLKAGSRNDYELVQRLVVRAQKTQNWVYGDMLMRIVWALLPDEAQDGIAAQKGTLSAEIEQSPGARIRTALRERLGYDIFFAWFASVQFTGCDGKTATFSVPVKFLATWIKSHYQDDLMACVRSVHPTVERVEIRTP